MRVLLDDLEALIPTFRRAGIVALDVDTRSLFDTVRAPPPDCAEPESIAPPTEFPQEEPKSDKVARDIGVRFVESPGEPEAFGEMFCAGARVLPRTPAGRMALIDELRNPRDPETGLALEPLISAEEALALLGMP